MRGSGERGEVIDPVGMLDVARRLTALLREHGLTVVLTRDSDRFVPLETRTAVANDARGDLFLSIHANSARSHQPRGIETYFVSLEASDDWSGELADRENQALGASAPASLKLDPLSAILGDMAVNEHVRESSEFAKLAVGDLAKVDPVPSRGVKQAPFVVLMGVRMPAALVEIGFLSNPEDEKALRTPKHRAAIAGALAKAVLAFGADYDRTRGVLEASSRLAAGKTGAGAR